MSNGTRSVIGVFRTPAGVVFPNKTLTWVRARRKTTSQAGLVVVDEPFFVTTNGEGAISADVMPGNYLVLVRLSDQDRYFHVGIPEGGDPFDIADGVDTEAPPITPSEVLVAQQARDDAESSAIAADEARIAAEAAALSLAIYTVRNAANAAKIAALEDGKIGFMGGIAYKADSTKTGTNSCTNDLGVDGLVPSGDLYAAHFGDMASADCAPILQRATDWMAANDSPNDGAIRGNLLHVQHVGNDLLDDGDLVIASDWTIKARAIGIVSTGRITTIQFKNGAQIKQDDSIREAGVRWGIGGFNFHDYGDTPSGELSETVNGISLWSNPMLHVHRATQFQIIGKLNFDGSNVRKYGVALGVGSLLDQVATDPDMEGTIFASTLSGLNVKRCVHGGIIGGMRDTNACDLSGSQWSQNWCAVTLINTRATGGANMNLEDNAGPQAVAVIGNYQWPGWTGAAQAAANVQFGPNCYVNANCENVGEYLATAKTSTTYPANAECRASDGDYIAINETGGDLTTGAGATDTERAALETLGFTIYETCLFRIGAVSIPGSSMHPRGLLTGGQSVPNVTLTGNFGPNNEAYRFCEVSVSKGCWVTGNNVGLHGDGTDGFWKLAGDGAIKITGTPGGDVFPYGGNRDNANSGRELDVEMTSTRTPPYRPNGLDKYDLVDTALEDNSGHACSFASADFIAVTNGTITSVSLSFTGLDTTGLVGNQQLRFTNLPAFYHDILQPVINDWDTASQGLDRQVWFHQIAGEKMGKLFVYDANGSFNYLSVNKAFGGAASGQSAKISYSGMADV